MPTDSEDRWALPLVVHAGRVGAVEIPPPHRPVRTFHPRRSRIGPTRQSVLTDRLPAYRLDAAMLDDPVAGDVVVEIGCGDGSAAIAWAVANPSATVVACDVHTPGIATLVARLDEAGVGNVRVHVGDALDVLERARPGRVARLHVFFPDPWPKNRHAHRRLVSGAFVELCARVLRPDGVVHVATDVAAYATLTTALFDAHGRFARCAPGPRAQTPYGRKGQAAGRASIDLAWRLVGP